MIREKYTQQIWILLAESFSSVVSDLSQPIWFVGKLIFCRLVLDIQTSCKNYVQYYCVIADIFGLMLVTFDGRASIGVLETPPKAPEYSKKILLEENKETSCILSVRNFTFHGPFGSFWLSLLSREVNWRLDDSKSKTTEPYFRTIQ